MLSAFWSSGLRVSVYIVCIAVYYCMMLSAFRSSGLRISVYIVCIAVYSWCYQLSGAPVCASVFILFVWLFTDDVISFLELRSARQCLYCLYSCLLLHDVISFQELWSAYQCLYCLYSCLFLVLSAFRSPGLRVCVYIVCMVVYFWCYQLTGAPVCASVFILCL